MGNHLVSLLLAAGALLPSLAAAQPEPVRCRSEEGVLPAGVYWVFMGWYEQHLDCPRPTVARVAGVHSRGPAVQRSLRRLRDQALEPGYPWVVHTRYLGLEGDGVAVVLGLFGDARESDAWAAARGLSDSTRTVAISPPDEALERFAEDQGGTRHDPIPVVTHLTGRTPIEAFDAASTALVERGQRAASRCRVAPGRVFVFRARPDRSHRVGYWSWMPVRCGGRVAWVRQTRTSRASVFWTAPDGDSFVSQVTSVECDQAALTRWRVDEQGRHDPRVEPPGGC